jgi:hypothetical protein
VIISLVDSSNRSKVLKFNPSATQLGPMLPYARSPWTMPMATVCPVDDIILSTKV